MIFQFWCRYIRFYENFMCALQFSIVCSVSKYENDWSCGSFKILLCALVLHNLHRVAYICTTKEIVDTVDQKVKIRLAKKLRTAALSRYIKQKAVVPIPRNCTFEFSAIQVSARLDLKLNICFIILKEKEKIYTRPRTGSIFRVKCPMPSGLACKPLLLCSET